MSELEAKHEGFGRWNVVNEAGEKQNTEPMTKGDAEKMASATPAQDRPNRNNRRRERVTFGQMRSKLSLDDQTQQRLKDMGKVGRWVNDEDNGGRLKKMYDKGYDFFSADGSEIVGDPDGGYQPPGEGSHMQKHVGTTKTGQPMQAYFMVTDVENYEEDAAAKEAVNRQVDDGIRGGKDLATHQGGVSSTQGSTSVKDVQYKP